MVTLKVGDPAPSFKGKDQNGNEVSLEQFRGSMLLLYFYPKDDTPGCTAEACNIRDNYQEYLDKGYKVLGVSTDSEEAHRKFITKYSLPFPLLADENKSVLKAYGAWGEKKMYGRSYEGVLRKSFVISADGKIEKIIDKVKTNDHTRQIF
ncbi:MAG: thioredoxin-dependent thiol peroxidase [Bacteroidota bacterium]